MAGASWRKTGYIGAVPNEDTVLHKTRRDTVSRFDLNGAWVPHTLHKVLGLFDAYLYCDNATALTVAVAAD
jgi:hypothetical protein